jgi:short-subunit dehydrogenase
MVNLTTVQEWNSTLSNAAIYPPDPVIVISGGTSGIGAASAKAFAKSTVRPRLYIIGRSQETADAVLGECRSLNPEGKFEFIKTDLSLIKNVDEISEKIKKLEPKINVLVLSAGEADLSRSSKFPSNILQVRNINIRQ